MGKARGTPIHDRLAKKATAKVMENRKENADRTEHQICDLLRFVNFYGLPTRPTDWKSPYLENETGCECVNYFGYKLPEGYWCKFCMGEQKCNYCIECEGYTYADFCPLCGSNIMDDFELEARLLEYETRKINTLDDLEEIPVKTKEERAETEAKSFISHFTEQQVVKFSDKLVKELTSKILLEDKISEKQVQYTEKLSKMSGKDIIRKLNNIGIKYSDPSKINNKIPFYKITIIPELMHAYPCNPKIKEPVQYLKFDDLIFLDKLFIDKKFEVRRWSDGTSEVGMIFGMVPKGENDFVGNVPLTHYVEPTCVNWDTMINIVNKHTKSQKAVAAYRAIKLFKAICYSSFKKKKYILCIAGVICGIGNWDTIQNLYKMYGLEKIDIYGINKVQNMQIEEIY